MKKVLFGMGLYAALVVPVCAQKPAAKPAAPKKAAAAPVVTAFLGTSSLTGGPLSKADFDKFIRQGIRAKEGAGTAVPVTGFQLTYAERGLYEDSAGNPLVTTDYLTEYCFGDTLSANLRVLLPERTKPGDTVFVDNIKVRSGGIEGKARSLRFVLTR